MPSGDTGIRWYGIGLERTGRNIKNMQHLKILSYMKHFKEFLCFAYCSF